MEVQELFDLAGRSTLVTGAGGGLGRAISMGLARAGARVAAADIDERAAGETARAVEETGGQAVAIYMDVTSLDSVEKVTMKVRDTFGSLDVLVNFAGIQIIGSTLEYSVEDWNRILAVNLSGTFFCCKKAGRLMAEQGRGSIINIASVHGHVASFLHHAPAYNASKAGVENLTRSLAVEWASRGVRVNAIAPGMFRTPMTVERKLDSSEYGRQMVERIPLGRFGLPEELVGPVIFLASDASSYITGEILTVDGGWVCHS